MPDTPDLATQIVDVRDLVTWLLDAAVGGPTGTFNTVGTVVPFREWIELSRAAGGHTGEVRHAPAGWLLEQGVEQWTGPEPMPMWLVEPGSEDWSTRDGGAALRAGLRHRPRAGLIADTLAWEREQGLDGPA